MRSTPRFARFLSFLASVLRWHVDRPTCPYAVSLSGGFLTMSSSWRPRGVENSCRGRRPAPARLLATTISVVVCSIVSLTAGRKCVPVSPRHCGGRHQRRPSPGRCVSVFRRAARRTLARTAVSGRLQASGWLPLPRGVEHALDLDDVVLVETLDLVDCPGRIGACGPELVLHLVDERRYRNMSVT